MKLVQKALILSQTFVISKTGEPEELPGEEEVVVEVEEQKMGQEEEQRVCLKLEQEEGEPCEMELILVVVGLEMVELVWLQHFLGFLVVEVEHLQHCGSLPGS